MQLSINVLMGRGSNATPSVALLLNKDIYLFNAPPLIFRASLTNNLKFKTLKSIFLTSNKAYARGGIHNFFESIRTSSANYKIYGPKNLSSYLCHREEIVNQDIFPYLSDTAEYNSPNVHVIPIEMSETISYKIVIDYDEQNFNQSKMKELKLKPGKWISDVKANGEVTENGIHIRKEDFFFVKHNHHEFLILDIHDQIDFEKVPDLNPYDCVIHFTPQELLTPDYFLHFPTHDKQKNFCFLKDPITCLKFSFEFYEIFTKSHPSLYPPIINGHESAHHNLPPNFISLFSNLKLIPNNNFSFKQIPDFSITKSELPRFSNFAVTFVGTGSAIESRAKGSSGILLHLRDGFIIIDCSIGYIQQLLRKYREENVAFIMRNLRCVWISHCHFDHFLGIFDILDYRKKVTDEELLICCDPISFAEIKEKEELYGNGDKNFYKLIHNDRMQKIKVCDIEIDSYETTHCKYSMGCVITMQNGKRMAYTGDLLDDGKFKSQVKNCDILIAEANYPNSMEDKCRVYFHSTNAQAEKLKLDLNAEYLIMVHMCNSYLPEELISNNKNSIYGFDFLCITDDNIQDIFSTVNIVKKEFL